MKIATWNVNSVRAREERLLRFLARHAPDVVCLQELKVTEDDFPFAALAAAGYQAVVVGQRTYNGVAILSRESPADVCKGLADDIEDPQARFVAATLAGVRVLSVYVPNGQTVGSEKYTYKLAWLGRLRRWLERHADPQSPLLLCGDLNIAPEALDVKNPEAWEASVLYHPEMRQAFHDLCSWGLVDAFRKHHPEGGLYSWWDYRMLGFPKNDGLRIDHMLATAPLAERTRAATIDREERKGKLPSDHAPVLVEIDRS